MLTLNQQKLYFMLKLISHNICLLEETLPHSFFSQICGLHLIFRCTYYDFIFKDFVLLNFLTEKNQDARKSQSTPIFLPNYWGHLGLVKAACQ